MSRCLFFSVFLLCSAMVSAWRPMGMVKRLPSRAQSATGACASSALMLSDAPDLMDLTSYELDGAAEDSPAALPVAEPIHPPARFQTHPTADNQERCYLIGLANKHTHPNETSFTLEESLSELHELARTAGLLVVGQDSQRISRANPRTYIGPGKMDNITEALVRLNCTCVVFDTELSPSQQANLEDVFNAPPTPTGSANPTIKVVDRTALILTIFALHAHTREGQLQVELALLTYRLPRLTKLWSHLGRQSTGGAKGGGAGLKGPGEKQLESDRRQMHKQIAFLQNAIDDVKVHRQKHRRRRNRLNIPVVALVGYTNSGKSTLLNTFTGRNGTDIEQRALRGEVMADEDEEEDFANDSKDGVFVADMLFATLDPTTRLVKGDGVVPEMLMTDTVGFIQKLPTQLVAAFRATLEELHEADLLLHVVDVSNEAWHKQEASVHAELESLGLSNRTQITVYNKADLLSAKQLTTLQASLQPNSVLVSAQTGYNLDALAMLLTEQIGKKMVAVDAHVHSSQYALINTIHEQGVVDASYEGAYVQFTGTVPVALFRGLQRVARETQGNAHPRVRLMEAADTEQDEEIDWLAIGKGRHRHRSMRKDDDESRNE